MSNCLDSSISEDDGSSVDDVSETLLPSRRRVMPDKPIELRRRRVIEESDSESEAAVGTDDDEEPGDDIDAYIQDNAQNEDGDKSCSVTAATPRGRTKAVEQSPLDSSVELGLENLAIDDRETDRSRSDSSTLSASSSRSVVSLVSIHDDCEGEYAGGGLSSRDHVGTGKSRRLVDQSSSVMSAPVNVAYKAPDKALKTASNSFKNKERGEKSPPSSAVLIDLDSASPNVSMSEGNLTVISASISSPESHNDEVADNGGRGDDDADHPDSAWTLDESTDEYFLTGRVDAIKGEVRWPKVRLPRELYDRLYSHQKVGVQWMASMHSDGIGGILGDDMGLGKTYQTLTFLGGLMKARSIRSALVVCPVSLLRTWENEAREVMDRGCDLDVAITVLSSDMQKKRRAEFLQAAMTRSNRLPQLIITTYGLITSNPLDFVLADVDGERPAWDYVVLDEGHKIKNPSTKTTKSCHRICRSKETHRLMLTGTPIQNNLKELWTLFDWSTSGRLLGKVQNFNNRYAHPIEAGRHKNASDSTIAIAVKANKELQELIRPHFLQRLKSVEFKDQLPSKREIVVWTHLSLKQRELYQSYVENGGNVQSILAGETNSPLEAITWLKKLCGHPLLVSWSQNDWDLMNMKVVDRDMLMRDSAKLKILVDLLTRLRKAGHRTLVFSQSTKMLNIIEKVLFHLSLARIDGSTKERERQRIVDNFNRQGSRYDVLLLSTKAAGLGLTLTGANRCVVYDPSWNPAEDSQAVDRCFRIGQSKKVTVYRFIAAGTVEERMYEKQVFKDGIRRAIMTSKGSSTQRYFNKDELRRLFQLAPAGICEMLEKFSAEESSGHVCTDGKENASDVVGASGKPSFLESHRHVVGLSSHDHLYKNDNTASSGTNNKDEDEASTPFAGTPLRERCLGKSGRALMGKRIDFGPSEGLGQLKQTTCQPIGEEFEIDTPGNTNARKERKPLSDVSTSNHNTCSSVSSPDIRTVSSQKHSSLDRRHLAQKCASQISNSSDEMTNAMSLLLDDLDSGVRGREGKLALHIEIALLAVKLGWL